MCKTGFGLHSGGPPRKAGAYQLTLSPPSHPHRSEIDNYAAYNINSGPYGPCAHVGPVYAGPMDHQESMGC